MSLKSRNYFVTVPTLEILATHLSYAGHGCIPSREFHLSLDDKKLLEFIERFHFPCIVKTHCHLCHVVEGLNSVLQQLLDVLWQQEPKTKVHFVDSKIKTFTSFNYMSMSDYKSILYTLVYLSIGTSMSSSICLSSKYSAAFLEYY